MVMTRSASGGPALGKEADAEAPGNDEGVDFVGFDFGLGDGAGGHGVGDGAGGGEGFQRRRSAGPPLRGKRTTNPMFFR
jgi:hypothetical protein